MKRTALGCVRGASQRETFAYSELRPLRPPLSLRGRGFFFGSTGFLLGTGGCRAVVSPMPPETLQARHSKTLIEHAKRERQELLRLIAISQSLIEQSREIIARLDEKITRSAET